MKNRILLATFLLTNPLMGYSLDSNAPKPKTIRVEKILLLDEARSRHIPIAIYYPASNLFRKRYVILLNHGYGWNKGNSYLQYSYIGNALAAKGYYVVSIQHELPTDSLIPTTGNPQVVRRPFWERGVENIRFVWYWLKHKQIKYEFKTSLIGHSNGGDIVSLFGEKYPDSLSAIITLDHRRFPLPRTAVPKISSLRSSDMKADEGVLPTKEEQKEKEIRIVNLIDVRHDEMDDTGKSWQKTKIIWYLLKCL